MKVIAKIQGTSALNISGDDVVPEGDTPLADIISYLTKTYQFMAAPQGAAFVLNQTPGVLTFQNGSLTTETGKIAIMQLALVPNGDVATAATTEQADTIIDDLIVRLDRDLNFRYSNANRFRRTYQSGVVVQFEKPFADYVDSFARIESILGTEIKRSSPFEFKKLGFGSGDPQPAIMTLESIEKSDFTIERRQGEQYSENRFFCSAPVTTDEHIRILQKIENEVLK